MSESIVETVVEIARAAGRIIEEVRAAPLEVGSKGTAGPVTEADRRADAFLKRELLRLRPVGWLSEETADSADRLGEGTLWIVDPLDGTKEFVAGVPEYAVAIALVESGEPTLGVVHNPSTGDTFWARMGDGAFRDGRPIRVSEGKSLLASRSELASGEFDAFRADWSLEPVGSIQWKLALVAAGVGAVTFSRGPKHEWDVCAGALIVEEAGGIATDAFGKRLRYNQRTPKVPGVHAGAPVAHDRALKQLRKVGPADRMAELGSAPPRGEPPTAAE